MRRLLIGFAGVVILMSKDIGASFGSVLGQLAVVLASAFYAGSAVFARRTTEDTPSILRSAGPLISATAMKIAIRRSSEALLSTFDGRWRVARKYE